MASNPLALQVEHLDFAYSSLNGPKQPNVLTDVNCNLPPGSRCILVGANGAGKSTLLQILAGKKLIKAGAKVLGQEVFFNTPPGLCYLGTEVRTGGPVGGRRRKAWLTTRRSCSGLLILWCGVTWGWRISWTAWAGTATRSGATGSST